MCLMLDVLKCVYLELNEQFNQKTEVSFFFFLVSFMGSKC